MTAPLSMLSVFPAGVLGSPLVLRRTREKPFPSVLWPVLWENRDRIRSALAGGVP